MQSLAILIMISAFICPAVIVILSIKIKALKKELQKGGVYDESISKRSILR